jgi:hypothetical protein
MHILNLNDGYVPETVDQKIAMRKMEFNKSCTL